jgi:hypothetical protein
MFGGSWVTGNNAPHVTGGTGALLSLGMVKRMSTHTDAGVVVRGSMQSLTIEELGESWDGGTAIEGQLLGTVGLHLPDRGKWRPQIDMAGGMTMFSGARSVFPFSRSGRLAPMADIGIAIGWRSGTPELVASGTSGPQVRHKELQVFARYGVVRLDPVTEPGDQTEVNLSTAGYVGRVTAGLRIRR